MKNTNENLTTIARHLRAAPSILIATHENPDPDAIGSALGLYHGLREFHPDVRVTSDYRQLPKSCRELPNLHKLEDISSVAFSAETTLVVVDSGELRRAVLPKGSTETVREIINIDHHSSNPMYGQLNWVDTSFAATGQMVLRVLQELHVRISPEIASCLYAAISTDTGNFRFSNTDRRVFEDILFLVKCGVEPYKLYKQLNDIETINSIQLQGIAFSRVRTHNDPGLITTFVTGADLAAHEVPADMTDPIIEKLQSYEDMEILVFFREDENVYKMSFRSRVPYDVSVLAAEFNGGGHQRAAGAKMPKDGPFEDFQQRVLDRAWEYLQAERKKNPPKETPAILG